MWTLKGDSRAGRIGYLWEQWEAAGAHLVNDDWMLPNGWAPFTDSGTYAPTLTIGDWQDEHNATHLFIVDGYAASAEAIQAASLAPILGLSASLAVLSSRFRFTAPLDAAAMKLDPDSDTFADQLRDLVNEPDLDLDTVQGYKDTILAGQKAGIPLNSRTITANDLISEKNGRPWPVPGICCPIPTPGPRGSHRLTITPMR